MRRLSLPAAVALVALTMAIAGCGKSDSQESATSSTAAEGRPDTPFFPFDPANQKQLAACPSGTSQKTSENGRESWCTRPDGTRHGPHVAMLGCLGIVAIRVPYVDGKRHGDSIGWRTGWLLKGEIFPPVNDAVCDILQLENPPDGQLMRVRNSLYPYREGKLHGLSTGWWSNGKKSDEGSYERGYKHGTWRQWDRAGKLLGKYTMDHGTGTERWWHDDGKPSRVTQWRNGKRHGVFTRWETSGVKVHDGRFYEGLPDGTWTQWSKAGKRLGSYTMKRGTGTIRSWHENGKLWSQDPQTDGNNTGTMRAYRDDGSRMVEVERSPGGRTVLREFDNEGRIKRETPEVDEKSHGVEKIYDAQGRVTELRTYDHGKRVSAKKLTAPPAR